MARDARKHITAAIALGLALTLSARAAAFAAPRIVVNSYSEISGDKITLGEIASISGVPQTEAITLSARNIGPAPKPDAEMRLTSAQVKTRIYNAGVDVKAADLVIPDNIIVKRRAARVTGKQLADFAVEFLTANTHWSGGNITVTVKSLPADIILADGEVTLEGVLDDRPDQYSARNFRINVFLNGKKVRAQPMSSYIQVLGSVVTAANGIQSGSYLSEYDLTTTELPLAKLPPGAITDPADAVGKKAKHNIPKGAVLTRTTMDVQPDVKTNDIVTIQLTGEGFSVTTKGKALAKGFKGDLIKVLAIGSKKVLDAVIIDSQNVEVISR